jgi:DNA-binding transcriptional regulator LsrR (DeoR family)
VPKGIRRPKRSMTDQERAQIALARFRTGTGLASIKELSVLFDRDPAVISKAISKAFRDGIVTVTRSPQMQTVERNADLENALRDRVRVLGATIVVETSKPTRFRANTDIADEDLQRRLGAAMASYLVEAQPFRDGDVVGVGSGTAVASTIDALRTRPLPFRALHVTLMSLSGSVHSRYTQRNLWQDSDTNTAMLSSCFTEEVSVNLVRYPLVSVGQQHERERTCLAQSQWRQCRPNLALLGVGIFAPGKEFFVEATSRASEHEPLLAPVHQLLTQLAETCKPLMSVSFTPVADICNHLLYVPPLGGQKLPDLSERMIRDVLNKINHRFVSITERQLAEIEHVMLVAGGAEKAPAISELLRKFRVLVLCTDSDGAKALLAQ